MDEIQKVDCRKDVLTWRHCISKVWDDLKQLNICVIAVPKEETLEMKNIWRLKNNVYFQKKFKTVNSQKWVQRTLSKNEQTNKTTRNIILKTNHKENILKAVKVGAGVHVMYRERDFFFSGTRQTRKIVEENLLQRKK